MPSRRFRFLGQSRYHLILTCGGCGKFHLVRYVEFEQLLELQFVVVECRAGHDDLVFVAHVLAFDLGEVDLADRPRPPHLAGPVALGAGYFGRADGDLHRFGGVERLHVGLDQGQADVVLGLLDRQRVDAVLQLLPADRRAELPALIKHQIGVDAVGPRVGVVVGDVRRRVVRVGLRRRGRERRQQGRPGLLRVLHPREVVVAVLPQLDVVLQCIVQTLLQRPALHGLLPVCGLLRRCCRLRLKFLLFRYLFGRFCL